MPAHRVPTPGGSGRTVTPRTVKRAPGCNTEWFVKATDNRRWPFLIASFPSPWTTSKLLRQNLAQRRVSPTDDLDDLSRYLGQGCRARVDAEVLNSGGIQDRVQFPGSVFRCQRNAVAACSWRRARRA